MSLVATVTPEESEAIERVVFYRGAIELGEDREPPYELLWEKAPEGIYFLSAKAYTGERMIVSPAIPVEVYGPHGGVPVPIPGVLAAEQFDYGGPGVGYHDADSLNRGGNYRHFEGVDIVADTEAETGYAVGWTKAGEWLSYLIDVTEMGPFKIQTRVASQGEGGQFRVEMNGVDVTGPLQVPCTGGWSNYTLVAKDGIALTQGVQSVRVVMVSEGPDGYVGAFDSISVFLQ